MLCPVSCQIRCYETSQLWEQAAEPGPRSPSCFRQCVQKSGREREAGATVLTNYLFTSLSCGTTMYVYVSVFAAYMLQNSHHSSSQDICTEYVSFFVFYTTYNTKVLLTLFYWGYFNTHGVLKYTWWPNTVQVEFCLQSNDTFRFTVSTGGFNDPLWHQPKSITQTD